MQLSFPVDSESVRRLKTPFDNKGYRCFMTVVKAGDIPKELAEWRKINPRDTNPRDYVSKDIRRTISERPDLFFFLNRGLLVLAKSMKFDNKEGTVTLSLDDPKKHGLPDGGHTFRVVMDTLSETEDQTMRSLPVRMEILTGFDDPSDVINIVEARNTSIQVKGISLLDAEGAFDGIKALVAGEPYADKIAYSEYSIDSEGKRKPISIREILSYLICFDIDAFDSEKHPTKAYQSKWQVEEHFSENRDRMAKLYPLLKDILRLRDTIHQELPRIYNNEGGDNSAPARFGTLDGVVGAKPRVERLYFLDGWSDYRIPNAYIYSILAAFRVLVIKPSPRSNCRWKADPFEVLQKQAGKLARRFGKYARDVENPNQFGKNIAAWDNIYGVLAQIYGEK